MTRARPIPCSESLLQGDYRGADVLLLRRIVVRRFDALGVELVDLGDDGDDRRVVAVPLQEEAPDLEDVGQVLADVGIDVLGLAEEEDGVRPILDERGADLVQGMLEVGGLGPRAVADAAGVEEPQLALLGSGRVPGRAAPTPLPTKNKHLAHPTDTGLDS